MSDYYIYKIYPTAKMATTSIMNGEWNSSWDTDNLKGTIGKIVSNYEDLTIANEKRIKRADMDVMSDYATCGSFSLEADYGKNYYIHADDEAAEPSDSVSRGVWATMGEQTWNTTSSFSSGTVENWQSNRLDVGAMCKKFRYSIKFGDVSTNERGELYIRPPVFDAQIKGKY